jgi:exopolyphosphatase/guanosine-5'-triphosphate,3'-diphosphate pyrophosphatase
MTVASLGIIDIGSNSIRLVLFETGTKGNFQIVNDLKESVRLEEGMLDDLNISEAKMEQAIDVLQMFKNMCVANEVEEIIAFGTQATRMANNRNVFLERVLESTGIKIQVLSGEEEAYFDYVAVVRSMRIDDCLIMDMGGGSTELVWCKNNELLHSISLPIGTINLTRKFKLDDNVGDEQLKSLRKYLQQQLDQVPWLKEVTAQTLIGIGGSIRNIGKIDRRRRNYPLDINHNYIMDKQDVKSLADELAEVDLKGRKEVKGLAGDRADIIVAPAQTFAYVLDYCCLDTLIVSGNGLREGYVFSHLWGDLSMQRNPLDFSLYNTLYNYHLNQNMRNTFSV